MVRKEEFQCSNSGSTLLSNIVAFFVAIGLSLKWVHVVIQYKYIRISTSWSIYITYTLTNIDDVHVYISYKMLILPTTGQIGSSKNKYPAATSLSKILIFPTVYFASYGTSTININVSIWNIFVYSSPRIPNNLYNTPLLSHTFSYPSILLYLENKRSSLVWLFV